MNSHETYLKRLIAEANGALEKANSSADEIKRFYNFSRFLNIIDAIKKEIHLLESQQYYIPLDIYREALKLLKMVE